MAAAPVSSPIRIETRSRYADGAGADLVRSAHALGVTGVRSIRRSQLVFVLETDAARTTARTAARMAARDHLANALVGDPLLVDLHWRQASDPDPGDPHAQGATIVVETALHPGVTDTVAAEFVRAAAVLGVPVADAATGWRYEIDGELSPEDTDLLARRVLSNPVIERWSLGSIGPNFASLTPEAATEVPERVAVAHLDDDALRSLSAVRGLALDLDEMRAVQAHFARLRRDPTDAELETIAQTWSEHCSHKSFRARIISDTGEQITPLLSQLRATTDAIAAPWVVSAFVGNAGIVDFGGSGMLAVKVETHNHPSAIEPFGGANTGVGGVLRDVMAAPARPIAATDVLCFGPLDIDTATLPAGTLHPQQVSDGVIAGVADYGNKIGVPTVAGAILHDPGYTANPLVFCGCVGLVAPGALDALTGPHPADRVVVLGGRTGRDGLRGATFSSMAMDATTGEVAGASVQIGDPITEKLVADALDEAVQRALFTAITDCGAGGLSSAVGEMADGIGARIDLAAAPLKYAGLQPWEIWLSEAQERMVLAVRPIHMDQLRDVCVRHRVEMTDLGWFTGDGQLVVTHGETTVLDLDTEFLHHGRPARELVAALSPAGSDNGERTSKEANRGEIELRPMLLRLLAHPTIASKEHVIHRYDHEVQGRTIIRPLTGARDDGPSDGVVLADPRANEGFSIGIGVNPWVGRIDPERMGWAVVDEAIRNVVVAGGDPDRVALLDNFSWGDPRRPSTFGALVETVRGCCAAALAHGAPFVSGKDSLNNEYEGADGVRHAIPPTLVITALAHVPDIDRVVSSDLKVAGNVLILTGHTRLEELRGSHLDLVLGLDGEGEVSAVDLTAPRRYRVLHALLRAGRLAAAHDCAEGGLAVALAEMAIGGRLGVDCAALDRPAPWWFAESMGRIVVEVCPEDLPDVLAALGGEAEVIGTVTHDPLLRIGAHGTVSVDEATAAWQGGVAR